MAHLSSQATLLILVALYAASSVSAFSLRRSLPRLPIHGAGSGSGNDKGNGNVPPPPNSRRGFGLNAGGGSGGDANIFGSSQQGLFLWLTKLLEQYSVLLDKHPYITKAVSSGIVGGSGDVLIQKFQQRSDKSKRFDWRRLAVFSTVAALYIAPVIHVWFGYLNNLPYPSGMSNLAKASIMILLDQTVGAVLVTVGFFYFFELVQYSFPPYPQQRTKSFLQAGTDSNRYNLWDTLVANWYCWPLINFVNFLVVPIQFRVLFSNFAAVFWNMFLSSVSNRKVPDSGKKTAPKK